MGIKFFMGSLGGFFFLFVFQSLVYAMERDGGKREERQSPEEIQQSLSRSLNLIEERRGRIEREVGQQSPSILFLGRSGAGKSTVITGLSGARLRSVENDLGLRVLEGVLNADVVIGHALDGGTRVPGAYYDREHQVVLWDCPGFGDPRGPEQEILNAASIASILKKSSQIKLVIVLSEDDLVSHRGGSIPLLFAQLRALFPRFEAVSAITTLVITHHEPHRRPLQALENLLRAHINLSRETQAMLRAFLDQPHRVAYVRKPEQEGEYVFDTEAVWSAIQASEVGREIRGEFPLTPEAVSYLQILVTRLNREITEVLRTHQGAIETALSLAVRDFLGTSEGLRHRFRAFGDLLDALVQVSQEDSPSRESVRAFEALPGFPRLVLEGLSQKINQIEILRLIAGQETRNMIEAAGGRDIGFFTRDWLSGLQLARGAVERMRLSLERPIRAEQVPLRPSTVEYREFFRLPDGSEKGTVLALPAGFNLVYHHQDALFYSIPQEQFTFREPGRAVDAVLLGNRLSPVAYEKRGVTVTALPNTLNAAQRRVSLRVVKGFLRPDGSLYQQDNRFDNQLVSCSHDHYTHDDVRHESQEFIRCVIEHEGTRLDLGVVLQGILPHARVLGTPQETQQVLRSSVEIRASTPVTYIRPSGQGQYTLQEKTLLETCLIVQEVREGKDPSRTLVKHIVDELVKNNANGPRFMLQHFEGYHMTQSFKEYRRVAYRANRSEILVQDWVKRGG